MSHIRARRVPRSARNEHHASEGRNARFARATYLSAFFMPAPLFLDSHKQWLAKGGHLGSWGSAATLKHNAFIVFQLKQQTCM